MIREPASILFCFVCLFVSCLLRDFTLASGKACAHRVSANLQRMCPVKSIGAVPFAKKKGRKRTTLYTIYIIHYIVSDLMHLHTNYFVIATNRTARICFASHVRDYAIIRQAKGY